MIPGLEPFLGLWALDRGHSTYVGAPMPRRGLYRLERRQDQIAVWAHWADHEGAEHSVGFAMVPDGQPHPLPDGSPLRCALDDGALISEVSGQGGVRVARRILVGSDAMRIVQDLGPGIRIDAMYRRVRGDVKQVLLYRRDLNMRKGKIAAQIAHASLKVFLDRDEGSWDRLEIPLDDAMASWSRARFAKIVLSVANEADLVRAFELARAAGLPSSLITDAGHTEFHGVPTRTTVAIGPAPIEAIDAIAGPSGKISTKLA